MLLLFPPRRFESLALEPALEPIVILTFGGIWKPNAFPTFWRSKLFMLKIDFNEYEAYEHKYDRKPSRAD